VADLKAGEWPGQIKCNIDGYHDPENAALYFYKLIPPCGIEFPPARGSGVVVRNEGKQTPF
jgi:hypothetical protein